MSRPQLLLCSFKQIGFIRVSASLNWKFSFLPLSFPPSFLVYSLPRQVPSEHLSGVGYCAFVQRRILSRGLFGEKNTSRRLRLAIVTHPKTRGMIASSESDTLASRCNQINLNSTKVLADGIFSNRCNLNLLFLHLDVSLKKKYFFPIMI